MKTIAETMIVCGKGSSLIRILQWVFESSGVGQCVGVCLP